MKFIGPGTGNQVQVEMKYRLAHERRVGARICLNIKVFMHAKRIRRLYKTVPETRLLGRGGAPRKIQDIFVFPTRNNQNMR